MAQQHTQLAVIGGGPGGYAAAFFAADLGIEVTLIDPEENPGGVCLYRGCIPSKTLLHVARLIGDAKEAKAWGVDFRRPKINVNKLRAFKEQVVSQLTRGLGRLVTQRRVTHIRGQASFIDNHTLKIDTADGQARHLNFEYAIIATGSFPGEIPGLGIDSEKVLDSTSALALKEVPPKLLIIGGGYIGLELGSVYAALGSSITVVEMTSQLLPGADRDLVRVLQKRLEDLFKDIRLQTTVKAVKIQKNGIRVTFQDSDGIPRVKIFDKVLMAVGRRPRAGGLGLENTRIELDEKGFIVIDGQRRTAERHIFAIGDVAGEPMLAHKASHEGRIAAEVIAGRKVVYEPATIPAVVFTDPEIAWAGLTEKEAKERQLAHEVVRYPWAASGRAMTLGRSDGLTKLVIEPQSERILGMGIVGPSAGEMIAEAVLAIEMAANVTDLSLSVHPHPTLSETVKEAADIFHGTATHIYRPKRKKQQP
jgi:dihydrolipoamide dehydrogenase